MTIADDAQRSERRQLDALLSTATESPSQLIAWSKRHDLSNATQADLLAAIEADHDEAFELDAERDARAIAASILIDGRPAEVTAILEAAELLNDARENLAALQAARARYDELVFGTRRHRETALAEALTTQRIFVDVPSPRADRLAAAFAVFNEQADSGGPGTARGVIAAVEGASTIDRKELVRVLAARDVRLGTGAVAEVLAALGFAIN